MKNTRFKQWVIAIALTCSCGNVWAVNKPPQPKSELVQMIEGIFYDKNFTQIPDQTFPAADYGVKADGKTVNTSSIQAALDAAHEAGGGVVTLPKGTTVSGALFVKSNVELRLDEGVILKAVKDDAGFPDKWTRVAGIEMDWPAALINVYEQENVRITGKGIIDGSGKYWWDKYAAMLPDYEKRGLRWVFAYDCKRVRPLVVYKSKNVLLNGFTVHNSGFWTVTMTFCDRVHVDGITIRNNIDGEGPSTDGIDADSSTNILIENCDIDCHDDNICLKAGRDSDGLRVNRPTKNVVVRNSLIGRGMGMITLGSETSGGIENVEAYGLRSNGNSAGFRLKSARTRGGVVRNIWIHDLKMDSVKRPFEWELNWVHSYSFPDRPKVIPESWPAHWKVLMTPVEPPERGIPDFHNIRISNLEIKRAGRAFYARAHKEKPLRDIIFENITIDAKTPGQIKYAQDWTMTNVLLRCKGELEVEDSINVQLPAKQ